MNKSSKIILASSMALLMVPGLSQAQENITVDVRTSDQVKIDLNIDQKDRKIEYKTKDGDNIKALAQAFEIKEADLEQVNDFALENKLDILEEDTLYTIEYGQDLENTKLEIETKDQEKVKVDLISGQVKIADNFYQIVDQASEVASSQPVYIIEEVEEFIPSQTTQASDKAETVEAVSQAQPQTQPIQDPVASNQEEVEAVEETAEESSLEESTNNQTVPAAEAILNRVQDFVDSVDQYEQEVQELEEKVQQDGQNLETSPEAVSESGEEADLVETSSQDSNLDTQEPVQQEEVQDSSYQAKDDFEVTSQPLNGLQPHVAKERDYYSAKYDVTVGGYRPGDPQDHGKGLALDFMVYDDTAKGDAIANEFVNRIDNGDESLSYVIWKQRIYGDWNKTWINQDDRGNDTQNHMDHVHVSYK